MFQLIEMLAMRAHLKRFCRQKSPVLLFFIDGGIATARIKKVHLATVEVDVLGSMEDSWMASYVMPITNITNVNIDSVERARHRLMIEHEGHDCSGESSEQYVTEESEED